MTHPLDNLLSQTFELTGDKTPKIQHYAMESRINTMKADGAINTVDIYKLFLRCVPAQMTGGIGDTYTCVNFIIKIGDAPEVAIPVLDHWSYIYSVNENYRDYKGQVLWIDHRPFEHLMDKFGNKVPQDKAYHVYNAFIDYHALCTVFAEKTPHGKGIQDLSQIGQKIVHASAFSKPEVNVNTLVSEGSYFENGQITLEFKGLGLHNGETCAIIGHDSGASRFTMTIIPAPGIEALTTGSSHYKGDIYKNLSSNWVEKALLEETVVSETIIPVPPSKIDAVMERQITILNISQTEFDTITAR